MKISAKNNAIQLEEVFNSVILKTADGEEIAICMRDTGFEFKYNDVWYSAQQGEIKKLGGNDDQLLELSIASQPGWRIGEKVVVTNCIYGHEFDNGTTVEIVDHEPSQTTSWLCTDGMSAWWLSEEEGYVC